MRQWIADKLRALASWIEPVKDPILDIANSLPEPDDDDDVVWEDKPEPVKELQIVDVPVEGRITKYHHEPCGRAGTAVMLPEFANGDGVEVQQTVQRNSCDQHCGYCDNNNPNCKVCGGGNDLVRIQ